MNPKLVTLLPLLLILLLAAFLRLYRLDSIPPSLYWDEVSLGYNAFSILQTGADEHGHRLPLTHFLAFGDAKPPLYIYATTAAMAVLGVGDYAVRFPSALAGILAVALTYLLALQLFPRHRQKHRLGLLAALLMAVSPWHLQMSRAGFEANLALTLFLLGFWAFLKGLTRPRYWFLTTFSFLATLYTFNAYRIFIPLFVILLAAVFYRRLLGFKRHLLLHTAIAAFLFLPLGAFLLTPQAQLRYNEVSIFRDHQPVLEANLRQELNGSALWTKAIHNRRVLFFLDFLRHSTDHFKPDFLFFSGDINPRLSVKDLGVMYPLDLPFLLAGSYILIRKRSPRRLLFLGWLLAGLVPAGIARETPHALRILQVLPLPQILASLGILTLLSQRPRVRYLVLGGYLLFFSYYLDLYYHHYGPRWGNSWQYGYQPLLQEVKALEGGYDRIYISDHLGRAYIYTLFYLQIDPPTYWQTRDAGGDAFGFTYTRSFGKYYFTDPDLTAKPPDQRWLIVTPPGASLPGGTQLNTIYDLNHQPIFDISKV